MGTTAEFAITAALMGDPVRAQILGALMDGRALTASELTRIAGVAPQTASGHLARLADGGLISATKLGRFRYFRISSPSVAHVIEHLWALSGELASIRDGLRSIHVGPRDPRLRLVRTCYDHLAGSLAVEMADSMIERGYLEMSLDGAILSEHGLMFLRDLGCDLDGSQSRATRVFCLPCLDWSERKPHLSGAVGAALCRACFDRHWLKRVDDGRVVSITPAGAKALKSAFPLKAARP